MDKKPPLNYPSQDYTAEQLYPGQHEGHPKNSPAQEEKYYPGGIYSYSEVGGPAQDQQNPWQGSQAHWQQL